MTGWKYGRFYGIIYVSSDDANLRYEEVKKELEDEFRQNKIPISDFVNQFAEKYSVDLPDDIFFNIGDLF